MLEADIRGFFDSVDHGHLRTFLDLRVRDGVLRRAIDKWLKAGVLEDGELRFPDEGTPQGGVISPLLGNIYLHEVLDKWFETDVKPRLSGRAFLVRYADDFVIVFSSEEDARRVFEVLPKRFGKHGLTLHPEKTRLVAFRQPPKRPPRDPREETATPGAFELLGFTHYWAKSRTGSWIVMRKTGSKRFVRSVRNLALWCRANRHLPVAVQRDALNKKLDGHYGYYGITNNMRALHRFFHAVMRVWHKWLGRRSRQRMTWERFNRMLTRLPLKPPRIVQSVYRA